MFTWNFAHDRALLPKRSPWTRRMRDVVGLDLSRAWGIRVSDMHQAQEAIDYVVRAPAREEHREERFADEAIARKPPCIRICTR